LGSLLGVTPGPIEAFIPEIRFAIIFGLSMDYDVFIVSRIHEEWTRRPDATAAIRHGISTTGRLITAAATSMICVFAAFALGDNRDVKLFGISLASAVLLDAFFVRSLLLPLRPTAPRITDLVNARLAAAPKSPHSTPHQRNDDGDRTRCEPLSAVPRRRELALKTEPVTHKARLGPSWRTSKSRPRGRATRRRRDAPSRSSRGGENGRRRRLIAEWAQPTASGPAVGA
jgi:hypothetical protein